MPSSRQPTHVTEGELVASESSSADITCDIPHNLIPISLNIIGCGTSSYLLVACCWPDHHTIQWLYDGSDEHTCFYHELALQRSVLLRILALSWSRHGINKLILRIFSSDLPQLKPIDRGCWPCLVGLELQRYAAIVRKSNGSFIIVMSKRLGNTVTTVCILYRSVSSALVRPNQELENGTLPSSSTLRFG